MNEEERSRGCYAASYIARESHPSRMAKTILIGRKYKIETSAAKIIPALNNNLKFFPSATIWKITKLCTTHKEIRTKKEKDFLTNFNLKTSNFYRLPKVHKSEEIKTAIKLQKSGYIEILNPSDLKFRLIVGGPRCLTKRINKLH